MLKGTRRSRMIMSNANTHEKYMRRFECILVYFSGRVIFKSEWLKNIGVGRSAYVCAKCQLLIQGFI